MSFTFRNCRDVLSCSFAVDLLNDTLINCPNVLRMFWIYSHEMCERMLRLYKYVHNVNDVHFEKWQKSSSVLLQ